MTSASRLFRTYFGALLITPIIGIAAAIKSSGAASADEALGEAFCMGPLLFGVFVLAVLVFLAGAPSAMPKREKRLVLTLSVAVIPMFLLVSGTSWQLGWPNDGASVWPAIGMLSLNLGWLVLVLAVGARLRRIRRGAPAN